MKKKGVRVVEGKEREQLPRCGSAVQCFVVTGLTSPTALGVVRNCFLP